MNHATITKPKIAVIGLGYVGLPLAVEFAGQYKVFGFDINADRVNELIRYIDHTSEVSEDQLKSVITTDCTTDTGLYCTSQMEAARNCSIFIITVPTPVDKNNRPDLTPLYKASGMVGKMLKTNDIVIYESTVYPGVTETECVPVLEKHSGLKFNEDFFVGYSPERINPGDKEHTVAKIKKVTSGSTPETAEIVDTLYKSIITAGTHRAPSIMVAEAAKVIENAQRDINIAFINELAKIFNRLGISTRDVLAAAGTKWNFLKFQPGLVGGHCIGVDPYYLAQKAQEAGYHPEIILAGRRLNDGMGSYVADELVKLMMMKGIQVIGSSILILGFTFKENCPDIRNTKVIDIVRRLQFFRADIVIYDPWASAERVKHEYGVICQNGESKHKKYDAIVLAVAHNTFNNIDLTPMLKDNTVVYDLKSVLPDEMVSARL
ncbi:nucleotide sugar dehydrogenase [Mucilaginibacter panaciglaebae]|uniref:Nucleotide sugar dehydrogenase n=1 Tax=Mucilaginibacter panaciglaebae TaxID=502331 RepID=A0ABP7WG51_9SPHI